MAKIIVLGAMKGGVGKSVSTYNLAYSLNKLGKKVLVVDFDSSANITRCVVEDIKTIEISIGDLILPLVISATTTLVTVGFVLSQNLRNSLPETVWSVLSQRNV